MAVRQECPRLSCSHTLSLSLTTSALPSQVLLIFVAALFTRDERYRPGISKGSAGRGAGQGNLPRWRIRILPVAAHGAGGAVDQAYPVG